MPSLSSLPGIPSLPYPSKGKQAGHVLRRYSPVDCHRPTPRPQLKGDSTDLNLLPAGVNIVPMSAFMRKSFLISYLMFPSQLKYMLGFKDEERSDSYVLCVCMWWECTQFRHCSLRNPKARVYRLAMFLTEPLFHLLIHFELTPWKHDPPEMLLWLPDD